VINIPPVEKSARSQQLMVKETKPGKRDKTEGLIHGLPSVAQG